MFRGDFRLASLSSAIITYGLFLVNANDFSERSRNYRSTNFSLSSKSDTLRPSDAGFPGTRQVFDKFLFVEMTDKLELLGHHAFRTLPSSSPMTTAKIA